MRIHLRSRREQWPERKSTPKTTRRRAGIRNFHLSQNMTWGKASRWDIILSLGEIYEWGQGWKEPSPYNIFRGYGGLKANRVTYCLPRHTQRQTCWFQLFYSPVFVAHSDSSYYPWLWFPFPFPSSCICVHSFNGSLQSETHTVGRAETNWSREKQISVSQSGSPTRLALRRVSNQCSRGRSQTISKIPADGWEIIATICCWRERHSFNHESPWCKSTAIIHAIWETEISAGKNNGYMVFWQLVMNGLWKVAGMSWQAVDDHIMKDLMTHMFQFYSIHWTGTIFRGLRMTEQDRLSPGSRDHGRIHMQRHFTHTHSHTLWRFLLPFHMKTHLNDWNKNIDHSRPFPSKKCTS